MAGRPGVYIIWVQFHQKQQWSQEAWVQTTACSLISWWVWGVTWPFRFHSLYARVTVNPTMLLWYKLQLCSLHVTQTLSKHILAFPLCTTQPYVVLHGQRTDGEDKDTGTNTLCPGPGGCNSQTFLTRMQFGNGRRSSERYTSANLILCLIGRLNSTGKLPNAEMSCCIMLTYPSAGLNWGCLRYTRLHHQPGCQL